ncbi:glycosyltransferase [Acidisoma cellulosilytica]|uniref:Glycosyltransferase n=1 Tax=Acidisoma cellulosilyticum TaxID=2802395 RepID=A0A963Z1U0_9PROT|nr:glycosyltransferase [Acidisoma cellulosilyticum]
MREVIIFRHNLFRISEPFITQQAQTLKRYRPVYLGRLRFGPEPTGASSLALRDLRYGWPMIGWQMLSRSPRPFFRMLESHRPALIHAHFGIEGVYALPLARRLGIPLITTFHGFDATLSTAALLRSPAWANYPLFRHQLAQEGALFLCASAFLRERVIAMGFPESRTHVHHIGVDCRTGPSLKADGETLTILHVARLVEMKGTEYLIRSFAQVAAQNSEIRLDIIGDGPLRASLEALSKSLRLETRIRFLGALPHEKVLAAIRRAAMLVLPSVRTKTGRMEGLGLVLLEAAANGLPTIGSRVGGIPEGVLDGETGFLVPERDEVALAARMQTLTADPALRRRMGVAARTFVEQRFDLHHQTSLLEDWYDTVLQRHDSSP